MDNILKKFYSGGEIGNQPENKIYENFYNTTKQNTKPREPFIQRDENLIPIVDNLFNSKSYPAFDKLMHTMPKENENMATNKSETMKIQMLEEKLRQLEKKQNEEFEQSIYRQQQVKNERPVEDEIYPIEDKSDLMSKMFNLVIG